MDLVFLNALLLDTASSPEIVASTLFGVMREAGFSLQKIKSTANFLASHVDIDQKRPR